MSKKILIVDDEPNMLRLGEYALKQEGYEILTAENGATALKRIQTEHPDLAILDVMLPDVSGIEVCRQLRANPKTANLPIIMLSARGRVQDKISGLKAGADEYLTKPIDWNEMVTRVSVLLERRRGLSEVREAKRGRVIGFWGAKGGVGTTTITVNIAAVLAQQSHSVLAAELTPGFSGFSAVVERVPNENLRHLLELPPEETDERAVATRLVSLPYGPRLLFGPQKVSEYKEIVPEKMPTIIQAMSKLADVVLLDIPALPSMATRAAIRECDFVALLIEPQPVCIAAGKVALETLSAWKVAGHQVGVIVVNQRPASLGIRMQEIKAQLNCNIIGLVPGAVDACMLAQRLGSPFVISQPEIAPSIALRDIANRLTSDSATFVNL